jgi:hypothetical protein
VTPSARTASHEYSVDAFGLDPDGVHAAFAFYMERFPDQLS